MTRFKYEGPLSVETLEGRDITFVGGQIYDLPQDSKRVKTLVNIGYLTAIAQKENITKKGR